MIPENWAEKLPPPQRMRKIFFRDRAHDLSQVEYPRSPYYESILWFLLCGRICPHQDEGKFFDISDLLTFTCNFEQDFGFWCI